MFCFLAHLPVKSIDLTRILVDSSPALASRLIGSHFFNPPSVMVLLEIIRTQETSDSVVADWLSFSKRLKKVPIVVRNCVGFTANRTFFPYGACAGWLVSQRRKCCAFCMFFLRSFRLNMLLESLCARIFVSMISLSFSR